MKDLLKQLRKYEIQIRKAVNWQMQGDFHSIFKGAGLEFDDVRSYQYGDDVRIIDWKVSAKGHGTFVKQFREEKEQLVYFLLDVSASQRIGRTEREKLSLGREICGVLTLSAIKENSQVGLMCFSDQNEAFVRTGKGPKHAYNLLRTLFQLQPKSKKTDLNAALLFALKLIRRRSVIILVSDFIDTGWEHHLKAMALKHDLVVIQLSDKRETELPRLGLLPLYEVEEGRTVWANTSSAKVQQLLVKEHHQTRQKLQELCNRYQADYLQLDTEDDMVPQLVTLFQRRKRIKKRA
jgi:uncharacterized protein (DUF58 family)